MTSTDQRENAKAWFLLNAQDPSDASLSQAGVPLTYIGLEESLKLVQAELQPAGNDRDMYVCMYVVC